MLCNLYPSFATRIIVEVLIGGKSHPACIKQHSETVEMAPATDSTPLTSFKLSLKVRMPILCPSPWACRLAECGEAQTGRPRTLGQLVPVDHFLITIYAFELSYRRRILCLLSACQCRQYGLNEEDEMYKGTSITMQMACRPSHSTHHSASS